MRLSGIKYESLVDGPGIRVAVFVQGCNIGCAGCHNPDSHPMDGGSEYTVRQVIRMMKKPGPGRKRLRGITFSGGEPTLQAGELALVAFEAKRIGWDVVTYTGRTYEDLQKSEDASVRALLDITDYLIDGPFIEDLRDHGLRFCGSTNQRVIDMAATRANDGRVRLFYG